MPSPPTGARGELPDDQLLHKLDDVERAVLAFSQRMHEKYGISLTEPLPTRLIELLLRLNELKLSRQ